MSKIITYVMRGNQPESHHEAKCIIKDLQKNIIFSTKHNNDLIFPRSAIKIFQAIPFASSGAINKFHLNSKQIALACSSHSGELFHIKESVDEIKVMVKEQNGRVRKLEQQTSAIKAIGSSVAVVFSAVIGWLFNTRS